MADSDSSSDFTSRIHAWLANARFFTVSLLIHTILLLSLGGVVVFKAIEKKSDFVAGGEIVSGDAQVERPPEQPQVEQQEFQPDVKVTATSQMDVIAASTTTPANFTLKTTATSMRGASLEGITEKLGKMGTGGGGGAGMGMVGGTVTFMGTQAKASSAIFVVDVSGSMISGEKSVKTYDALEKEVVKVVKGFSDKMSFGLVVFSKDALSYHSSLVRASTIEKERALNWLRKHGPERGRDPRAKEEERAFHHGTRADRGLEEAFSMRPDVIFFVSDGEPTGVRPAQILEKVQAAQKNVPKPIVINVVAYLADSGQKFMKDLAVQNQGTFREVNPRDVK